MITSDPIVVLMGSSLCLDFC